MKKIFKTFSAEETKNLGEKTAKEILSRSFRKEAVLICLKGNLGSGKTTFLQGFAKGLGVKEKILSPTFVIIKRFQLNNSTIKQFNNFFHIDCYRIKEAKEILELGIQEIIKNPKNIVAVEWPERIKKILPRNYFLLEFNFDRDFKKENKRLLKVAAIG